MKTASSPISSTSPRARAGGRLAAWLCCAAMLAGAPEANAQAARSAGDPARGKSVAQAKCIACHGLDGQGVGPEFPRLAGQLQEFLALQLTNYKTGERPHPVMAAMAKEMSAGQIADVSAYYAGLPPMRAPAGAPKATPDVLARGEAVFKKGKPGAPACQYCHGANGQGLPPVFARLAGQNAKFVVASIQPYRKLDDFKNPYAFVMKAVVQNLSEAEIEAVAAYLETLR